MALVQFDLGLRAALCHFIGAARLKLLGGFVTAQTLGVTHAAGEVARLVIGLGDDELDLSVQNACLAQGFARAVRLRANY